eukprot:4803414-Amphidinium_carterae.1
MFSLLQGAGHHSSPPHYGFLCFFHTFIYISRAYGLAYVTRACGVITVRACGMSSLKACVFRYMAGGLTWK